MLSRAGESTTIFVANVRRWKHAESLFFKPAKKLFGLKDMTPVIQLQAPLLRDMAGHNRLRLYEFRRLSLSRAASGALSRDASAVSDIQ